MRRVPTQISERHQLTCPPCQCQLRGIRLARERDVTELPASQPVEVIHHRIFKSWRANGQHWHDTPADLHEDMLGQ